jgi:hypothetical protein
MRDGIDIKHRSVGGKYTLWFGNFISSAKICFFNSRLSKNRSIMRSKALIESPWLGVSAGHAGEWARVAARINSEWMIPVADFSVGERFALLHLFREAG